MSEFFDNVNEYFFNPLTGENRQLYLNCINQLLVRSKDVPDMHETDAIDELTWYFRNKAIGVAEDIENEVSSHNEPRKNASSVLRYFRKCGWISKAEMDRNGDNFATITSPCRLVIFALNDILRQQDSAERVTNYVMQMRDSLNTFLNAKDDDPRRQQPYQYLLKPLMEDVTGCEERLQAFKEQAREIMQSIMASSNAYELVGLWEANEKQDAMFQAYNNIKNNGVAEHDLAMAAEMMDQVLKGQVRADIIRDYQAVEHINELSEAERQIDMQIDTLTAFANVGYKSMVRSIDKKLTEYWNLFSSRLAAVRRMGFDGKELSTLLMKMKDMDDDERNQLLSRLQDAWYLPRIRIMGLSAMKKPKVAKKGSHGAVLSESEHDEKDFKKQADDFLTDVKSPYSRKNVRSYIDAMMEGKDKLMIREDVQSREDMIMLLLQTSMEDDPPKEFHVDIAPGVVDTPAGRMSNIVFERRTDDE